MSLLTDYYTRYMSIRMGLVAHSPQSEYLYSKPKLAC